MFITYEIFHVSVSTRKHIGVIPCTPSMKNDCRFVKRHQWCCRIFNSLHINLQSASSKRKTLLHIIFLRVKLPRELAGFTYLAGILCIRQLLERKNWKMFPAGMVGMYHNLICCRKFL